ncbi:hypothetical protein Murru_3236 [Allomuricauda ruestringensis DSM 13258]|uniref:Uncharacterized protein n=1 Tax=Allomuricauda ruestringensis (strain DSM 13258 / CIP 107369 / LMG 19739 / B1) TaxID=886377 RepID=G2PLY6_ALLRU|nr:hypothetical protein Murru_3236 [Allomuricauda ruestringensis DSM 13258]
MTLVLDTFPKEKLELTLLKNKTFSPNILQHLEFGYWGLIFVVTTSN